MTIRVKCDECGSVLKIKDELAGKDGSCPKCKAAFVIPAPSKGESSATSEQSTNQNQNTPPADDEDDIFGKDFFKMGETDTKPKQQSAIPDNDTPKVTTKNAATVKSATTSPISSSDAAADVAGKLLAKTGKKNKKPEQLEAELMAEQAKEKLDLTEIKYVLSRKLLPIGGAIFVAVLSLYWLMSSMFSDKLKRPELGRVQGIVTVDGKPAANADVRFIPGTAPGETSKWSQSYGTTDTQGVYKLSYTKDLLGGVIGNNKAQVTVLGRPYEKDVEVKPGDNEINLSF